mmetsp:Transcript_94652/g.267633  ORF Transcript_94652/g.267633 Transcript_94652/m.267633 type:complete len:233 (-) Transcript_94652:350-1048(-)
MQKLSARNGGALASGAHEAMALEIFAMRSALSQYFSSALMPFFSMSSKIGFSSGSSLRESSLPDSRSFAASVWIAGLYMETSSRLPPTAASAACAVLLMFEGFTANCSPESIILTTSLPVPSSVALSSAVGGTIMAFLPLSCGAFERPWTITSSPGLKAGAAAEGMPGMPGMPVMPGMPSMPPVAIENFLRTCSLLCHLPRASKPFFSMSAKNSFISGSCFSFSTPACIFAL